MPLIYDYKINFHLENNHTKKSYQIVEKSFFQLDSTFILYLNNNQYRQVSITSNATFSNLDKNQDIYFEVKDVITFHIKIGSNTIYYYLGNLGSKELLKYWLYHTFLPILFTLENRYYFIHGGCVKIENTPVLFIADSYGGKSTLTDYFLKKDHTLISDDKVGTFLKNDEIFIVSSYPYHRPYRKVEDLGYFYENFLQNDIKIGNIYNLIKSEPNSDITIKEIFGIEKFTALRYSTDMDLNVNKEKRFHILSNIANKTRVFNITIPWDLDRLEEVYQTIIKHNKGQI